LDLYKQSLFILSSYAFTFSVPEGRLWVFFNILHINWGKIKQILPLSTEQFALYLVQTCNFLNLWPNLENLDDEWK